MIGVSLVRQFVFCPRIVYYNLFTNIKPIFPRQVSLGKEYHALQDKMLQSRSFKKLYIDYDLIINNKYLEDEDLGICGSVDLAFVTKDEVIPIEFKHIKTKPNYSHILQLVGYGILLSKHYKKDFSRAFVVYSNNIKFYPILITQKQKQDFLDIIGNIEAMYQKDILPNSNANNAKCLQCEYLNYCNDRF